MAPDMAPDIAIDVRKSRAYTSGKAMSDPKDAEIPDLKKAATERAPAPFSWAPGAVMPRAGAGPAAKKPRPSIKELLDKLRAAPFGKAALFALPLVVGFGMGLAVLAFFVLEFGDAKPGGKGGLGALSSKIRVRPDARNRLRYLVSRGEVFFGTAKKAAPAAGAAGDGGLDAAAAAEEAALAAQRAEEAIARALEDGDAGLGAAPSGTRAGASGGGSGASLAVANAAPVKAPAPWATAGPKLTESAGKLNAKSVKKGRPTRASLATGGRPGASSGKREPNRPAAGARLVTGAAASPAPVESRGSGLDYLLGGAAAGGAGPAPAAAAAPADAGEGGGAGTGAGAGSGAGPGPEPVVGPKPEEVMAQVQTLIEKSAKESDKAADELKKAKILTAAGQLPQAHYHYERGKKAKKKSEEYSDQAAALSRSLTPPAE
jgi:hypothetical protein